MRPGIRSLAATAIIFCAASLSAATVSKLNEDTFAQLREPAGRRKIALSVALSDRRAASIEVEQFEVWAPGGKVWIHSDSGIEKVDPPARRFYRGLVSGEPESFAFFSVDESTKDIDGLISIRDRKFTVGGRRASTARPAPRRFNDFLTETGPEDEIEESERRWQCDVDKMHPNVSSAPLHASGPKGLPVVADGISGTQSYAITVEIETDNEMFVNAGSVSANVTNYVTNLTGALSTIYNRDLKTNVTQTVIHVYTSVSDPWTAATEANQDTFAGLLELGDYYHNLKAGAGFPNTVGRTTSAVVMLSGKDIAGGVAWTEVICGTDFANGPDFGGPYAWCGGITKLFGHVRVGNIPDVNTPPYALPPSLSNGDNQDFWPLLEYSHELGHNLAGHHTHCIALTTAEATASGRSFVDTCYNNEGQPGCFTGTPPGGSCNASGTCSPAPVEKGTIMSYCHNVFVGLSPQSRYTFGQLAPDVSHHQEDDYMLRAGGPLGSTPGDGRMNIVNGVGSFTITVFNAPATVGPSTTGNAASITAPGATSFAWTITNGTITAGQGTAAITFTAGASGTVTLRASAYGANRCGVTDTKTVAIVVGFNPPTGVVATYDGAISVNLTWTAPAGTPPVQYDVYRSSSTDYTSFILATTSTTTSATDSTVSGNDAYLYKVRSAAAGGVNESGDSNLDIATIVVYTNPTLTVNVAPVTAADMNDLRRTADAVHRLAKLGPVTFTNPAPAAGTSLISVFDISDIRQAINTSFFTMGVPTINFTDPLIAGTTLIKALHATQARNGTQ